jgi:hypothetical protein
MPEIHSQPRVEEKPDEGEKSVKLNDVEQPSRAVPPFSIYKQINGIPYTAKFFDIKEYGQLNDLLDINNTREKVTIIERYVASLIDNREFEDTVESFNNLMDEVFMTLNIDKNEKRDVKLDKIYNFIKMSQRAKELERGKNLF